MRATKRVLIGNLAAASDRASFAVCTVTPSISKITRPGLTRATHNTGVPLPEPIRTSAGYFDTGTSGKIRIQTRPARFMWRVSARRAASIWRAVMRSGAIAFRPNWPNDNVAPEVAMPWIRPLCAFRNFVFFGCIMALRPQTFSISLKRRRHAVIDVRAQGVQRHAPFAIPLHACDFGTAETARAVDTDALGAETHRR